MGGWLDGFKNEQIEGGQVMDGLSMDDGWVDGWMVNGWMDEWMDDGRL